MPDSLSLGIASCEPAFVVEMILKPDENVRTKAAKPAPAAIVA
jgi:hypothetical protein